MAMVVDRSEEEQVRALEARMQEATRSHDVRTLRQLLHPSACMTSAGVHYTTRTILRAHETRRLSLTRFSVVGEVTVRPQRGGFVASFRAVLSGTFDGRRCDGVYLYVRTWRCTTFGWRAVSMSATAQAS